MILLKTQNEKHILDRKSDAKQYFITLCKKTLYPSEILERKKITGFKQERFGVCKNCLAIAYKNLAHHINKVAY